MARGRQTIILMVLAVVLFFAVNIVANTLLRSARLDLTQDKLFTLSDGTRHVLSNLEEPVTLRFFFSNQVATPFPSITSYANRVEDLLTEYAAIAGSNLRLERINPEPFSEAEDRAVSYGLRGVPTGSGDLLYFGVAGSGPTGAEEIIPFFNQERERFLEYDLTKLIQNLSVTEKPVIGLITGLPMEYGPGGLMAAMQGQSQPYVLFEQLQQIFDVEVIDPGFTEISADIALLVIIHPGALSEQSRYAVDQFILAHGRALIVVDPLAETAAQTPPQAMGAPVPETSDLPELFDAWGVVFDPRAVVADRRLAQRVSYPTPEGNRQLKDYVAWLGVPEEFLRDDDVVTAELSILNLASTGYFEVREDAGIVFEPLVTTSSDTMILAPDRLGEEVDPNDLLRDFRSSGQSYVVATRVLGTLSSAFSAGPPEGLGDGQGEDDVDDAARMHLSQSVGPVNLILIADSDFVQDRFWVQTQEFLGQRLSIPIADNGNFLINAIDNLLGSDELISLRSRGVSVRPFTVVDQIQLEAESRFLAEEQRLQERLSQAEQRVRELQSPGESVDGGTLLTVEEQSMIEVFRQEILQTRRQLREVQRNLRQDIETLGMRVRFVNIGFIPILIIFGAGVLAIIRHRKRSHRHRLA